MRARAITGVPRAAGLCWLVCVCGVVGGRLWMVEWSGGVVEVCDERKSTSKERGVELEGGGKGGRGRDANR